MNNPIDSIQNKLLTIHNSILKQGYIVERVSRCTFKKSMEVCIRLHNTYTNQPSPLFTGFYYGTEEVEDVVMAEIVALQFACQAYGLKLNLPDSEPKIETKEVTREDIIHHMGNTVKDVLTKLKTMDIDLEQVYQVRKKLSREGKRITKEVIADTLMAKPQKLKVEKTMPEQVQRPTTFKAY